MMVCNKQLISRFEHEAKEKRDLAIRISRIEPASLSEESQSFEEKESQTPLS
jgi:hypothetical protein